MLATMSTTSVSIPLQIMHTNIRRTDISWALSDELTMKRKPTMLEPTYPAESVTSAETDQNSCGYVGMAYGSRGTRGNGRISPRTWVAPPSFGSIQIETT